MKTKDRSKSHSIRVPKGEEKERWEIVNEEKRKKEIFNEIIAENFPNLVRQIYRFNKQRESQTGKTQRNPH